MYVIWVGTKEMYYLISPSDPAPKPDLVDGWNTGMEMKKRTIRRNWRRRKSSDFVDIVCCLFEAGRTRWRLEVGLHDVGGGSAWEGSQYLDGTNSINFLQLNKWFLNAVCKPLRAFCLIWTGTKSVYFQLLFNVSSLYTEVYHYIIFTFMIRKS